MKKLLSIGIVTALILTAGVTTAFAYCNGNNCQNNMSQGVNYVDENEDGICDNKDTYKRSNFVDENEDEICDNNGTHKGSNFVDEDENGVCDNKGTGQKNQFGNGNFGKGKNRN